MIHADICGRMIITLYGGSQFMLAVTVVEQRYMRVPLLKNRKNLEGYCHQYIGWIERHTKMRTWCIHTDYAVEAFEMRIGIKKWRTAMTTLSAYTPQYVGVTGRMIKALLDKARSMLKQAEVKKKFWAGAVQNDCIIHSKLKIRTPTEARSGAETNSSRPRIFLWDAYSHVEKENCRSELVSRDKKVINLSNEYALRWFYLVRTSRVITKTIYSIRKTNLCCYNTGISVSIEQFRRWEK